MLLQRVRLICFWLEKHFFSALRQEFIQCGERVKKEKPGSESLSSSRDGVVRTGPCDKGGGTGGMLSWVEILGCSCLREWQAFLNPCLSGCLYPGSRCSHCRDSFCPSWGTAWSAVPTSAVWERRREEYPAITNITVQESPRCTDTKGHGRMS